MLNKYYSFAFPFSPMWTFWYIREASTAIYVANIPNCWPLVRRLFHLRSFTGTTEKSGTVTNFRSTHDGTLMSRYGGTQGNRFGSHHGRDIELERGDDDGEWRAKVGDDVVFASIVALPTSESKEHISADGTPMGRLSHDLTRLPDDDMEIRAVKPLEIWQDIQIAASEARATEVNVERSSGRPDVYDKFAGAESPDEEFRMQTTVSVQPRASF